MIGSDVSCFEHKSNTILKGLNALYKNNIYIYKKNIYLLNDFVITLDVSRYKFSLKFVCLIIIRL